MSRQVSANIRAQKKYIEWLRTAHANAGSKEAMLVAEGEINMTAFVAASQDFGFMGSSIGVLAGGATEAACSRAIRIAALLVEFVTACGARMQEGVLTLMQMPRMTALLNRLKQNRTPLQYVVALTNPSTGGEAASCSVLGEVQIAESRAPIGFAGPGVIEETVRERFPEGFQHAGFLLEQGKTDRVTRCKQILRELAAIA